MMLRRLLLIPLALILTLLVFTLSPWGTKLLLSVTADQVDNLDIEYQNGSLAGELAIKHIKWQDEHNDIAVNNVLLDVDWGCVLKLSLCLTRLSSGDIDVRLKPSESVESTPISAITLPFPVAIERIALERISVLMPDNTKIDLSGFASQLRFYQTLNVSDFTLANLSVNVPAEKQQESNPTNWQTVKDWQYRPPENRPISLPIAIQAPLIAINSIEVKQGVHTAAKFSDFTADIATTYHSATVNRAQITSDAFDVILTANIKQGLEHNFKIDVVATNSVWPLTKLTVNGAGRDGKTTVSLASTGNLQVDGTLETEYLSAKLPVNATLRWHGVTWPFGDEEWKSDTGGVSLVGDMTQYTLRANAHVAGRSMPASKIELSATGNHQRALLEKLLISTLGGTIESHGELSVNDTLRLTGNTDISAIQPDQFWPELEAHINGHVSFEAKLAQQFFQVNAQEMALSGKWLNYDLQAAGSAVYSSETGLRIPQLSLHAGDNHVQMQASLTEQNKVNAKINVAAADFSQILPSLSGQSVADVNITGSLAEPDIEAQAVLEHVTYQGLSLARSELTGSLQWSESKSMSLSLNASQLNINQHKVDDLSLSVSGPIDEQVINIAVNSDLVTLDAKLNGSLTQHNWNGHWQTGRVNSKAGDFTINSEAVPLLLDWVNDQYNISAHCWLDNNQQLCFDRVAYRAGHAELALSGKHLSAVDLLTKVLHPQSTIKSDALLNLSAKLDWHLGALPSAQFNASLTPASWQLDKQAPILHLNMFSIDTRLQDNSLNSEISLMGEQIGSTQAELNIANLDAEKTVDGKLIVSGFDLAPFIYLAPALTELSGEINADLTVTGALLKPDINGSMALSNGSFIGSMLPARINQLQQKVIFNGQQAQFSGPFKLGQGDGQIAGDVAWQDNVSGNMKIVGEQMEVDYQNILKARLSPNLEASFSPDRVIISGELAVPYARIKVRELPPTASLPSEDAIFVDQQGNETEQRTKIDVAVQLNIDKDKSNQVKLDAFGLTSDLQGHLLLGNNSDVFTGDGELRLTNGRYQSYGQDLVIRRGEMLFSGPLDSPLLNIDAIRDPIKTADDVIAGLRITGVADGPEVAVFSEPSLEQSEALSYLLRGQSIQDSNDTSGDAALANALIGFGLSKSENKVTRAGEKLGIEDLALSTTGQGEQTKLSVSGYVAPGVQLRYGVGVFDSASEVALRYQILPKLYLEAVSGLNNALDLYYQFSSKTKKTKNTDEHPH